MAPLITRAHFIVLVKGLLSILFQTRYRVNFTKFGKGLNEAVIVFYVDEQ